MQLLPNNPSDQSKTLTEKILNKIEGLSKPSKNFFINTIFLFLSMRGRYTFKGFERYGQYCEKSYRLHFEKEFDFLVFNVELAKSNLSENLIIAFDPCYLPKSGKHTPGKGRFWSGCLGQAAPGLEIGGLAVIDLDNNTALSLESIQTPNSDELKTQDKTIVNHYADFVINRSSLLSQLSEYLVVDAYFSKQNFINAVLENTSLQIVSKLRQDANLKYLYNGPKRTAKGRPQKYAGKVNTKNIDKRKFRWEGQDQQVILHSLIVWSVSLKRKIKVVHVQFLDEGKSTKRFALLYSTDLSLDAWSILKFYKSRFQIEFLFRDAKQFTGLSHCQARSKNKIYFHTNMALTSVGIAKIAHFFNDRKKQEKPFSMASIKTSYFNELMLNLFISNFQIDPELIKNKSAINKLLCFGNIAA